MARRAIQFVALASLLYWASGLAHYAHERMDHQSAGVAARSGLPTIEVFGHNPDDCPICQVLATMRGEPSAVPAPPIAFLFDPLGDVIPSSRSAVIAERLLTQQSRGPPIGCA